MVHPTVLRITTAACVLAIAASAMSGCATALPLKESEWEPAALTTIRRTYERLVERARRNPDMYWHTGPLGNIVVNQIGGAHRGLCYQWQEYLYLGLLPTVERAGWRMTGIAVNENKEHEHHCVMVWDPELISEKEILKGPPPWPVYVLDVWRPGNPNVYMLHDWLEGEKPHEAPPRIQRLPESMVPLPTPGRWVRPRPNARSNTG